MYVMYKMYEKLVCMYPESKEDDVCKTLKCDTKYKQWKIKIDVDNHFIWCIVPVHSQYILNSIHF